MGCDVGPGKGAVRCECYSLEPVAAGTQGQVKDQGTPGTRYPVGDNKQQCTSTGRTPEDPTVPYPRPPPSVELRSGVLYSGCQCLKRDGLQHDCPRTGCQGRAPCMAFPAPMCGPSGHAPVETSRQHAPEGRRPRGPRAPQPADASSPRRAQKDDKFLRMGRCGYVENPPVKHRRVPCSEHRKTRG